MIAYFEDFRECVRGRSTCYIIAYFASIVETVEGFQRINNLLFGAKQIQICFIESDIRGADLDAIAPCPACGGTKRNLVELPSYCPNNTEHCANCDTFLSVVPKIKKQRIRRVGRGGAAC